MSNADQIERTLKDIRKRVLPVGHTIRTQTTLAAAPADLDRIRHYFTKAIEEARADGYQEALEDAWTHLHGDGEQYWNETACSDLHELAEKKGIKLFKS